MLNTALDAIDTNLKAVEVKTDKAFVENLVFPILSAGIYAVKIGDDPVNVNSTSATFFRTPDGIAILSGTGVQSHALMMPIAGLAPGMRITGFKSRGQAPSNTIVSVGLRYRDNIGGEFSVGSTNAHGTSLATLSSNVFAHDVVADRQYYFYLSMSRSSGTNEPFIGWAQPTVTRP